MNTASTWIPRVLIDTTILIAALITDGHARNLLRLARSRMFFEPVITNVCLWELYSNACGKGINDYKYSYAEVEAFLTAFIYPLLGNDGAVNSLIGRHHLELVIRTKQPLGEMLVELAAASEDQALQIINDQGMQLPLERYDAQDFHVWSAAISEKADVILTSNTRRFPEKIGNIQRIGPHEFYSYLGIPEDE